MSVHSFPALPGVAINMMSGDVTPTFGTQNYVLHVSVSDTKSNTRSVLRVVEGTHPFTTRDKQVDPSEGFRKACELRCLIATRCSS